MRRLAGLLTAASHDPIAAIETEIVGLENDNLAAVADALAEAERRLAEAHERLTQARDQVGRDAAAAELERDCQAVDAAAKAARDALDAFRQAAAELTNTTTPLVAGQAGMGWRVPPERVGTILVANLLATDLPAFKISTQSEIFEEHWQYGREIELKPEHAADPVGAVLTDRLRLLVEGIRTGTASPELSRWQEPEPTFAESSDPDVQIYPTGYFTFKNRAVEIVHNAPVPKLVPKPVADAAVKAGIATLHETPASRHAESAWHHLRQQHAVDAIFAKAVFTELPISLAELHEADVERRRAAWLAEREQVAA